MTQRAGGGNGWGFTYGFRIGNLPKPWYRWLKDTAKAHGASHTQMVLAGLALLERAERERPEEFQEFLRRAKEEV